jgi:hypothetical protein
VNARLWVLVLVVTANVATGPSAVAVPPVANYGNATLELGSRGSRYSPQKPTVSPYIAMTSNTNNLQFLNYFTITRPAFAQQATNRRQNVELQQIERQLTTEAEEIDELGQQRTIRSTGHHSAFMTQGPYFRGIRMAAPAQVRTPGR